MKTLLTVLAVAALTLPALSSAEGLTFKRSSNGIYDDYTGQITVSGEYSRDFDDEVQGDVVCFVAKGASAKLIPRKKGDERTPWFCFRNQKAAAQTFKISKRPAQKGYCGYKGTATVTVNQYSVYREISEGSDLAHMISAKNVSAPKPTKCYSY